MHHPPQFPDSELADLCADLADGTLAPERARLLAERLRADPAARKAYLEAMELECMLHYEFPDSSEGRVSATAFADNGHLPVPAVRAHRLRLPLLLGAGLAAALALLLFLSGTPGRPGSLPAETGSAMAPPRDDSVVPTASVPQPPIARVTRWAGARASASGAALGLGSLLAAGTIRQESGQLELTLDSGVVLVLNAGAVVDLESPMRVFVRQGRIAATVPVPARGFVVNTPTGFIRDLGTQFGIEVSDTSATEVHVLRGKVEAASTAGNDRTVLVHTAQAVRIGSEGVSDVPFARDEFSFAMSGPELETVRGHLSWSFDAQATGGYLSGGGGPALQAAQPPETAPHPVPGVFGQGLAFNGSTDALEAPGFFGIGGDRARTLAFWVAIPPEAPTAKPNGMVAWGRNAGGEKWQLSWNCDPSSGVVGALRQEFGLGFVIGSTDLRDGRWHHVAVVFLGGTGVDVSTHVKLYVDGRLEPQSARRQQTIRTSVDPSETRPLSVGRYVGPRHRIAPRHFLGRIDELHLFEGALTPRQIWQLMQTNRTD